LYSVNENGILTLSGAQVNVSVDPPGVASQIF